MTDELSGTRRIQLTNGGEAIVDACDYEQLTRWSWRWMTNGYARYAVRGEQDPNTTKRRRRTILMHRHIMQPMVGLEVDHINGDGLDNRGANLRVCTPSENHRNSGPRMRYGGRKTTSRFKGVTRYRNKWRAQLTWHRRFTNLGIYDSEEAAARAYDEAILRQGCRFARLNFAHG